MLKDLSVATAEDASPIQAGKTGLRIGGAAVLKADVPASNGIIHIIDTVLIPK